MKRWAKWIPWAIALLLLSGWIFGAGLGIVGYQLQRSWMYWLGVGIIVLSALPTAFLMLLGSVYTIDMLSGRGMVVHRQLQLLKKRGIKQRVVQLMEYMFLGVLPKEEEEEKEMS